MNNLDFLSENEREIVREAMGSRFFYIPKTLRPDRRFAQSLGNQQLAEKLIMIAGGQLGYIRSNARTLPQGMNYEQRNGEIKKLYNDGVSTLAIGRIFSITSSRVYKILKELSAHVGKNVGKRGCRENGARANSLRRKMAQEGGDDLQGDKPHEGTNGCAAARLEAHLKAAFLSALAAQEAAEDLAKGEDVSITRDYYEYIARQVRALSSEAIDLYDKAAKLLHERRWLKEAEMERLLEEE